MAATDVPSSAAAAGPFAAASCHLLPVAAARFARRSFFGVRASAGPRFRLEGHTAGTGLLLLLPPGE